MKIVKGEDEELIDEDAFTQEEVTAYCALSHMKDLVRERDKARSEKIIPMPLPQCREGEE